MSSENWVFNPVCIEYSSFAVDEAKGLEGRLGHGAEELFDEDPLHNEETPACKGYITK
jgi:hypothetical protein